MTTKQTDKPQQGQTQALARTDGERFANLVMREFSAAANQAIELTPYQRKLAQHLFLKIDVALEEAEKRRATGRDSDKTPPIIWANVNLKDLALSAMHRIDLGLDALVENHIHPIPYLNGRTRKYDVDLRIGYMGKDYYRRSVARDVPVDVIYELVYTNDKFRAIKRSLTNPVETYEFEIANAFDRGDVVGGFGYLMYEDTRKNTLVLVTAADFAAAEKKAGTDKFWGPYPIDMKFKTIVHRTMKRLAIDPAKANASLYAVEASEEAGDEASFREERDQNANRIPLDISAAKEVPASTPSGVTVNTAQIETPPEEEPPF